MDKKTNPKRTNRFESKQTAKLPMVRIASSAGLLIYQDKGRQTSEEWTSASSPETVSGQLVVVIPRPSQTGQQLQLDCDPAGLAGRLSSELSERAHGNAKWTLLWTLDGHFLASSPAGSLLNLSLSLASEDPVARRLVEADGGALRCAYQQVEPPGGASHAPKLLSSANELQLTFSGK